MIKATVVIYLVGLLALLFSPLPARADTSKALAKALEGKLGANVYTASLGINHAKDETEARELIAAMTTLLP